MAADDINTIVAASWPAVWRNGLQPAVAAISPVVASLIIVCG